MDVMAKKVTETKPAIKQEFDIGRPTKPIDWNLVDKMLEAGCSGAEIAPHVFLHPDTFYDRVFKEKCMSFTEYACKMAAKGDANLKLTQYLKAIGEITIGDNTQLIWLGKNRLKQRENPTELTVSTETIAQFKDVMSQVKSAQEALKSAETTSINE